MKIKIIKKEKDGVTLLLNHQPKKFTWEEFNEVYTIDPENIHKAVVKPEVKEKFDKLEEKIGQMVVAYLRLRVLETTCGDPKEKAAMLLTLGSLSEEISNESGISTAELLNIVKSRVNAFDGYKSQKPRQPRNHKPQQRKEKDERLDIHRPSESAILSDNPALLELKKKLENNK